MPSPKILAVATVTPPHAYTLEDVLPYVRHWLKDQPDDFQDKAEKVFRNAEVERRYSILPLDQIFSDMSFETKNNIYSAHVVDYAEQALKLALEKSELTPQDIDCLIAVSCTGHMSPSLDSHLIDRLNMKAGVQCLPVMEMGCMGGAARLMYAENYLRAYPDRYVALVCAELTNITFQTQDFSWANIVSAAIFGDGVACAILGPTTEVRPQIKGSLMHHFANSKNLLGYRLSDTGFRMVLDPALPSLIKTEFKPVAQKLLAAHHLTLAEIQHFIVHPGGKKILHDIAQQLKPYHRDLNASWEILKNVGNVSSATVLFILENVMRRPIQTGETGLLITFGPGFTACLVLLAWR